MKKLSVLFAMLAVLLSDVMCALVGYNYAHMLCQIEHGGAGAPASVAFLLAIPFLIGIVICSLLAWAFGRKRMKNE